MAKTDIVEYIEQEQKSGFYPTPENVAEKILESVDWSRVHSILEPSAGKGDILRVIARHEKSNTPLDIDCIELDPNLRAILKNRFSQEEKDKIGKERASILSNGGSKDWETGKYKYYDSRTRSYVFYPDHIQEKAASLDRRLEEFFSSGIHIVHDDFLTYTGYKQYQLIVMNPPFEKADQHLLKAIKMQEHGGQVICILNAETIKNPYSQSRKDLIKLLHLYDADISYMQDAFTQAERRTGVEIAVVKVDIPAADSELSIFEKLAKAKDYKEPEREEGTQIEVTDFIKAIVNRYQMETESGIELMRTFERMKPYLSDSFTSEWKKPLLQLNDSAGHHATINGYVKDVRGKYWRTLLDNEQITGKLTSALKDSYRKQMLSFADYDFSEFNINALLADMNANIRRGIEDEILVMFDRLTQVHSYYPEFSRNRYLYDGWKTNQAWKIGKKCILPCYGVFSEWDGTPRTYQAYDTLSDIERILNFFSGKMNRTVISLQSAISGYFDAGITKNIPCEYFNVTFYKKGTVHIVFTCPELIDRFNIYAAQSKRWLPPSYGSKSYEAMDDEERAVIDSFQGKEAYEKVIRNADYYLAPPSETRQNILAIAG